jgi:hypothetical protein
MNRMIRNVLLVLTGLLLGCGAGVSALHAADVHGYGTNHSAPRWEQFCELVGAQASDERALNAWLAGLGKQGWEVVGVTPITTGSSMGGWGSTKAGSAFACFRRPVSSS